MADATRWGERTVLATLVSVGVFLLPVGIAVGASFAVADVVPEPRGGRG